MSDLKLRVKEMIIERLKLEGMTPDQIEDGAPLFGEGLGLDSIDAFELGIALKKAYGLQLDGEKTSGFAHHFRTPATLAAFVATHRQVSP